MLGGSTRIVKWRRQKNPTKASIKNMNILYTTKEKSMQYGTLAGASLPNERATRSNLYREVVTQAKGFHTHNFASLLE